MNISLQIITGPIIKVKHFAISNGSSDLYGRKVH